VVETRGRQGLRLHEPGAAPVDLPVRAVSVRDATGAGDTLAGGFIAAEMAGASPTQAAEAGLAAAARLLTDREGQPS
jgi:ribokinase